MQADHVLSWELHGAGSQIAFVAQMVDGGYALRITRDEAVVLSDVAPDGATLLRKSSELRAVLQGLGFAPKPPATRASQLVGGVCWGPGAPLDVAVVSALA